MINFIKDLIMGNTGEQPMILQTAERPLSQKNVEPINNNFEMSWTPETGTTYKY